MTSIEIWQQLAKNKRLLDFLIAESHIDGHSSQPHHETDLAGRQKEVEHKQLLGQFLFDCYIEGDDTMEAIRAKFVKYIPFDNLAQVEFKELLEQSRELKRLEKENMAFDMNQQAQTSANC